MGELDALVLLLNSVLHCRAGNYFRKFTGQDVRPYSF